jgi:heme/copper-type cytochrome/quinol oxidase subunit 2
MQLAGKLLLFVIVLLMVEFLMVCLLQYVQRRRVETGEETIKWSMLHTFGIVFMAWFAIMMVLYGVVAVAQRDQTDQPAVCSTPSDQPQGEGTPPCQEPPANPGTSDPTPR